MSNSAPITAANRARHGSIAKTTGVPADHLAHAVGDTELIDASVTDQMAITPKNRSRLHEAPQYLLDEEWVSGGLGVHGRGEGLPLYVVASGLRPQATN